MASLASSLDEDMTICGLSPSSSFHQASAFSTISLELVDAKEARSLISLPEIIAIDVLELPTVNAKNG